MSIRKRGENYWEICISEGTDPKTGRQLRTYHSFRGTEREARAEHTRLQYARDSGMSVKPSRLTLGDYLDSWLNDYARLNVTPGPCRAIRTWCGCISPCSWGSIPCRSSDHFICSGTMRTGWTTGGSARR